MSNGPLSGAHCSEPSDPFNHKKPWIIRVFKNHGIPICIILGFIIGLTHIWKLPLEVPRGRIIWSDSEGYYMYLPAVFILKDVHKVPVGSLWPHQNAQGEQILKYTCGVAIMQLPFFLVAKWYCQFNRAEWTNYFNLHYVRAIAISGYFYAFLGLFFLALALKRRFNGVVTVWTILSVFLGTNLFYYATIYMTMSHAYSFCLFAMVFWLTPRFYSKPTYGCALALGMILGLITLIRPTNVLVVLLVLLYDVYSNADLRERVRHLLFQWRKALFGVIAAIPVFIPQSLYWKTMTGHFIRYSYTGEGFIYWLRPKLAAVLLDTQNGLLLYSPMVVFMLIGIAIGLRHKNYQAPALAVIFLVSTYLFASWWAWWFGGARL